MIVIERLTAPVGCEKCRGVAFCSSKCLQEATSTYHAVECNILDVFIGSGMSMLSFLAVRMLTRHRNPAYFLQCRSKLENMEHQQSDVGDGDDYGRVYNLVTLASLRNRQEFFDRTVMAIFLFKCLRTSGFLPPVAEEDSLEENEVWMATLLLRHLQLVQFNAHEIQEFSPTSPTSAPRYRSQYIGVGIYPTAAYFNHSCQPDVSRCFVGTSMVLRASRSIASGQSVSENYGPIFTHKSRADRQCSLKGRYWFQCQCRPCFEQWPSYDGMTSLARVLTRCAHCGGDVQTLAPLHTYGRCQTCKKQTAMAPIEEHVARLGALYHSGMRAMDEHDLAKAAQLLSGFIDTAQRQVGRHVVRELYLAQEALRLCTAA